MKYRSGLEVKKAILKELRGGAKVISQLERKIRTSDRVLKRHLAELEYLGIVKITKHVKSEKTGRAYTTAELVK